MSPGSLKNDNINVFSTFFERHSIRPLPKINSLLTVTNIITKRPAVVVHRVDKSVFLSALV